MLLGLLPAGRYSVEAGDKLVPENQASLELLSRLLARIVHDFNNPLAAIIGFSELLKNPACAPEKRTRYIERIYEQATRLSQVVEMMAEFSAIRSAEPTQIALDKVVRDMLSLRQGVLSSLAIQIDVILPDQPVRVVAEQDGLVKAISILLNNLEQVFKEHPGVPRKGMIRCGVDGNVGFVDVLDAGPGVPTENAERIFEPFFSTRRSGGLGLGLTVARSLLRRVGGDVVLAEPQCPLGGARFRLTAPLVSA